MNKDNCLIQHWNVINSGTNEMKKLYLSGTVFNHAEYVDGSVVQTSMLVAKQGEKVVTETGCVYSLGNFPYPGNEKMKEYLMKILPEKEE